MDTTKAQQKALDDALVAYADRLEFGKCNMRLQSDIKPKEATFQVVLDSLALTPFYRAFLITTDIKSLKTFHWNMISSLSLEILGTLETSPTSLIHEDTQVYGTILPKELTNQAMLESKAYKTYCAFASREKTPKPKYVRKKTDSDTSPKQKPIQATKGTRIKTKAKVAKSDKKKQPAKGDSEEEDKDDENDSKYKSDGNDDDDANDDENQEGDDTNDDDEETDSDSTESDRIKILVLDQSTTEFYEEEEEKIDDEETMDEEEDDEVTKELYDDVNMNLGNKDTKMTNADQGASEQQNVSQESSSSVSSDFTSKLLNLENPSLADNEIASLLDTITRYAIAVPEVTSSFTTTIPLPPLFFNPLSQQETLNPTPTTSKTTTSLPALLDFDSVFRFNDRLGEAIYKAIQSHNAECRKEAQAKKQEYIDNVDSTKNVTESLEAIVLTRSSSQPKSTYEAAASLSEYELTKIILDKIEESKSHLRADYKKKLYDAQVESYNTDKDIFESYGEVFSLKRSRDDKDKDQDPFVGSDRGMKRRKSSKDTESSRDSRSAKDQEFDIGNNDEQPTDKEVTKDDWFKKPE
ncbi:hypothetical protein Tco_0090767 [Tanacetum coccineum]